MTRVFQSLPPRSLHALFGLGTYAGVGLDVVPPLFQGISLIPAICQSFMVELERLSDADIRSWSEFRKAQLLENPRTAAYYRCLPRMTKSQYQKILREMFGGNDFTSDQNQYLTSSLTKDDIRLIL